MQKRSLLFNVMTQIFVNNYKSSPIAGSILSRAHLPEFPLSWGYVSQYFHIHFPGSSFIFPLPSNIPVFKSDTWHTKQHCYLHGTNVQIAGVNSVPYWIQHFLCVPIALRQPSTKPVLGPIWRINNHKVYIQQGWLWKITFPFLSLTYNHPAIASFLLFTSVWRVLWPQNLPWGQQQLQGPTSHAILYGFLLLLSKLPSETCLRFCSLNTVDEVNKLLADEVKLTSQEI